MDSSGAFGFRHIDPRLFDLQRFVPDYRLERDLGDTVNTIGNLRVFRISGDNRCNALFLCV